MMQHLRTCLIQMCDTTTNMYEFVTCMARAHTCANTIYHATCIWVRDTYVWVRDVYGTCKHWCKCPMWRSIWWYASSRCVTRLTHVCDTTLFYVHTFAWMPQYTCFYMYIQGLDSFMCVIWLIPMWDTTHACMGHDSLVCVTWLIHVYDMTRACVDMTHPCVTWLIHVCAMPHACVGHGSLKWVTRLIHICLACV